jgi:hypothetical protein
MTISFEVGPEFLGREDIPLSVDDLKFGFDRGWLGASTVIDWAVHEVEGGDADPVLFEVASLLRDDVDELSDVLARLDSPDHIYDPRESARKWLYLQMKAAYDRRQDLEDPLGVVEEIYADFEYPPTVEGFVRYMPLGPRDEPGDAALVDRWADFLRDEHDALRAGSSRG